MITIVRDTTSYDDTLTLTADVDQVSSVYQIWVTVFHEWGDIVVPESLATRTAVGEYKFTIPQTALVSAGNHKIHWRYTTSSVTNTHDNFINVYQPYMSASDFFSNHPELETDFADSYDSFERRAKNLIDTHCGQRFEPYYNKLISMDGQDTRQLYFNYQINNFKSINFVDSTLTTNDTADYTSYVEVAPESNRVIRFKDPKNKFSTSLYYQILADWGWQYVPPNVSQAADLIIYDQMSDDSTYRQHAIETYSYDRGSQNTFNVEYMIGSTGNIDADVLLMDYTVFLMSWV
jgi:hypothetical protein